MRKKIELTQEEITLLPSGEQIVLLSTKMPLWDKEGNITGIVGNTVDITYIKKIEQELKTAEELAKAANHAKDEFLANMSHDIRTPLTGIIGMSSILEQEAVTPKEKEHAHLIAVSGEQLLSLLNSVLDIVSVGNGQENQVQSEPVNIRQLLHTIAELELPTIQLKHLELITAIDESVPNIIKTDSMKLHRILLNLLGNAVKFTETGCITLTAHYKRVNDEKGELELQVRDTGSGIAKENQGKIFDRFYRGNPSYKAQYTGYGVGLHIVQNYIHLLKGHIELESELNQGTTFKIIIPVEIITNLNKTIPEPALNSKISILAPTHVMATQNQNNYPQLLLIEDNPIALKIVESIAKQVPCRYLSATTGEQALELFQKETFDLILSDIGLPGISGNEMTAAIRTLEKNLGKMAVPIIGLTAHSAKDTEQESLKSGMNKILCKPLTLSALQEVLNHFLTPKLVHKKSTLQINELPENTELFHLEKFPLLDIEAGITMLGSIEMLQELLASMFNDELPKDMEAIKKAYAEQNWELVEKIAHKIKSGALYCGVIRMKYACQYLERYKKSGQSDLQNPLYQQLIAVIIETNEVVVEWLKKGHCNPSI